MPIDIRYEAGLIVYALREGTNHIDGYLTPTQPYRILRYIGIEAEDQESIKHPDWYAIAWTSLIQLLPNVKRDEVMLTPDFPIQADHVKFHIVKAECEEVLRAGDYPNAEIDTFDGDIILILHQQTEK
jgi:hypothetical protein